MTKKVVDSFKPGCEIPRIQLKAVIRRTERSTLFHRLFLNPEINTEEFVTVEIDPTSQGGFSPVTGSLLTFEDLKRDTRVSDVQLDKEITEHDLDDLAASLSSCGDILNILSTCAGLTDWSPQQISLVSLREILNIWRRRNHGGNATYRKLIETLLSMNRQDEAMCLCSKLLKPPNVNERQTQEATPPSSQLPVTTGMCRLAAAFKFYFAFIKCLSLGTIHFLFAC